MAVTPNKLILPQGVENGVASLVATTPVTSRANIVGTAGLVLLKSAMPNGGKIYEISWVGLGTTLPATLFIWRFDGITARLFDEMQILGAPDYYFAPTEHGRREYDNLVLDSTEQLFCSVSAANDINVFAACSKF